MERFASRQLPLRRAGILRGHFAEIQLPASRSGSGISPGRGFYQDLLALTLAEGDGRECAIWRCLADGAR
jgi:hypothetical protein